MIVLAHCVHEGVGQAGLDDLLAGLLREGHGLAFAVVDRIDGGGWAPLAARGQRRSHVRQLQRVHPCRPEGVGTEVLRLLEVRHGLIVEARGAGVGVGPQAQPYGHVDHRADPDRLDELDECRVRGLGEGIGDGQRRRVVAGILDAVGVGRAPRCATVTETLHLGATRHLQRRAGTEAALHRCSRGEDLEDRAGTVADECVGLRLHRLVGVGVEAVRTAAAHGENPVRVLARSDDVHDGRDAVEGGAGIPHERGLGRILDRRVEGGADQVAALVDLFPADAGVGQAEEAAVPCGDAAAGECLRNGEHAERLGLGLPELVGSFRNVLDHRVQHDVASFGDALLVGVRVERRARLHHAREHRRLLCVEVAGVDAEVGLCRVLDAERGVAERYEVQVPGEDLVLGQFLVQRQRHPDLADLASGSRLDGGTSLGVGLGDDE